MGWRSPQNRTKFSLHLHTPWVLLQESYLKSGKYDFFSFFYNAPQDCKHVFFAIVANIIFTTLDSKPTCLLFWRDTISSKVICYRNIPENTVQNTRPSVPWLQAVRKCRNSWRIVSQLPLFALDLLWWFLPSIPRSVNESPFFLWVSQIFANNFPQLWFLLF